MNSRLRRGRIMAGPLSVFEPPRLTFQHTNRKPCPAAALVVSHCHAILSAAPDRRLSHLHLAAAADRAVALPRIVGARPVAGSDGDRLLRFPRLAGGDL